MQRREAHAAAAAAAAAAHQQHEVAAEVGGAGEVEALALAARQVDAAQAGLALVAQLQDLEVELEGAGVQHALVALLVEGLAEDDVVLEGQVLAPAETQKKVRRGGRGGGGGGGRGGGGVTKAGERSRQPPRQAWARAGLGRAVRAHQAVWGT